MDGHVNLFRGALISLKQEGKLVIISSIVFTVFIVVSLFVNIQLGLGLDGYLIARYVKTTLDYCLCLFFILRTYPEKGKFIPKF